MEGDAETESIRGKELESNLGGGFTVALATQSDHDSGELCFRIALSARRTGRWFRSKYVRACLLPTGAPCLHGGGQVSRERSRHPVGFRDVRLPRGREYSTTAPGSFRILFQPATLSVVVDSSQGTPFVTFERTKRTTGRFFSDLRERHPCSNRPGFFEFNLLLDLSAEWIKIEMVNWRNMGISFGGNLECNFEWNIRPHVCDAPLLARISRFCYESKEIPTCVLGKSTKVTI